MDDIIGDWCLARLRDAAAEDAIDRDTPEHILQRESARMARQMHQLASSFIDNEFQGD